MSKTTGMVSLFGFAIASLFIAAIDLVIGLVIAFLVFVFACIADGLEKK